MNYLASQLIERAKKLADINNTDFLDYDELIQYINDSWTSVYSWLINKGDTQFVKEVYLANGNGTGDYTEYKLPTDFYIMKSIKDKISGRLIERQAESEGINSGKYDIVNDKLRLYGNTSSNIVITYWTIPTFITFPDKEILVDNNLDGVLTSAGNSVLFDNIFHLYPPIRSRGEDRRWLLLRPWKLRSALRRRPAVRGLRSPSS